jgi:hypothetical protein
MSNFIKICPVGVDIIHADRQTDGRVDITKPIVAFHDFANEPNNENNYGKNDNM